MTKIDIFSGFLGAGKTTLIKKLIKEAYAGEKVVLIENEFGEIGIDGGFLQEAGVNITEMNSGCICCSLVGDFSEALKKVAAQYAPDRIIIEPSGVGKLSDVIKAVASAGLENATLNAFCTVVDAAKCKMYMKNFGEFFNDQVENASCIILSHTDKISEEKLAVSVGLLKEKNAEATLVTAPWGELCGKDILAAMERKNSLQNELENLEAELHREHECHDPNCHCHEHHHEHGEHGHGREEHHHEHECHDPNCHCHEHHHEHGEHGHGGEEHHHEHGEHGHGCEEHHHEHECHDPNCCCHEHHHEHGEHGHGCEEHRHEHECDDPNCHCHEHHHEHGEHGHGGEEHHHEHGHHHADDVFRSWGVETTKKFTEAELNFALSELRDEEKYGIVLRAKGIVAGENGWWHFDYVPEEPDLRTGSAGVTGRLCVIGCKLNEAALKELFKA